ncbi:ankyrin repeat-containing domain protein [Macrophomina phaseolina]|uniref:Ankyrin repeat-containing domain protein n=1 Tax=Macrophomina phaseolina TaxID=35725 RepID=A0ABQ8GAL3_9PEZI|nr:ankyrin repeat-containing domain protein [Macrophomina phaseolina]
MSTPWETQKETLRDLYLVRDLAMKAVMKQMEKNHGFKADAGQYERQFKKWGFRKNLPLDTWQFVARRIEKRKREGKDTEFRIDGIRIPQKKLVKATSRYGEGCTWKKVQHELNEAANNPSPIPEGLSFSPQALSPSPAQDLNSRPSLPWLEFSKFAATLLQSQPHLSKELAKTGSKFPREVSNDLCRIFLPAPHDGASQPRGGLSNNSGLQNLMLTAFFASNHITDVPLLSLPLAQGNKYAISSIVQKLPTPQFSEFLGQANITQDPTLDALSAVLFKEALKSQNVLLVRYLLETFPLRLNELLPGPWEHALFTDSRFPLHIAILSHDVEMVQLLLDHGADPDQSYPFGEEMFNIAVCEGTEGVIRKVLQRYKGDPFPPFRDALDSHIGYVTEQFWMELMGSTSRLDELQPDLLIVAAKRRWYSVVQLLLDKGADVNAANSYGHTPLFAVIDDSTDSLEMATLLVASGANVEANVGHQNYRPPTALQMAVFWDQFEIAEMLVNSGADANAEGSHGDWNCDSFLFRKYMCGRSALSIAANFPEVRLTQLLLSKGAEPDDLALACAVEKGRHGHIPLLLEHGAPYSHAVLFAAARSGNLDIIQQCLHAGFNANHIQDKVNALSAAASYLSDSEDVVRFKETCELLLSWGADINLPGAHPTALQIALIKNHTAAVDFLISRGAHCDAEFTLIAATRSASPLLLKTILTEASTRPNFHLRFNTSCLGHWSLFWTCGRINDEEMIEMADIIIHAGVSLIAPCAAKALQKICARGKPNMDLILKLIEAGIQLNIPDTSELPPCWTHNDVDAGRHPLQLLAQEGHDEAMRLLLRFGANPCLFGKSELYADGIKHTRLVSILCSAVESRKLSTVKLLLEAGSDVNSPARGPFGRTALQTAAELGEIDILEELVRTGADINADPASFGGVTALQAAAIGGFVGIAAKLVEWGAEVNAAAAKSEGRTALEGASEHGRIDMVQFLLNAGADIESADFGAIQYERAVDMARERGHNAVARLLQRHRESLG